MKLISIDSAQGLLPWSKSGQPGNPLKSKIESREREQVTNDRCTLHQDVEVGQVCLLCGRLRSCFLRKRVWYGGRDDHLPCKDFGILWLWHLEGHIPDLS